MLDPIQRDVMYEAVFKYLFTGKDLDENAWFGCWCQAGLDDFSKRILERIKKEIDKNRSGKRKQKGAIV